MPQKSGAKTGKESLAENWILHKLTTAAKEMNRLLAEREFSLSTQVVYQYWYNHLCDVYIENSKAIIQDGTPEEQRSAKDTLYTALEGALTMIHPYMPFLTEELWQRLPRRPDDKTPSIVLASYPTYSAELDDPKSEEAYDLCLGVAKGVRSLMADYNIKDSGRVFVQTYDDAAHSTVSSELPAIKSLSGKGIAELSVLSASEAKPNGCMVFAVSSAAAVFLHVKGRVDLESEITKAHAKMNKATEVAARQKKILDDPGYKEKVKEELQEVERKKLKDAEAEAGSYAEVIEQFERVKLEG